MHFDQAGVRSVYAFAPNAILDVIHIALWLGVSERTAQDLPIKWLGIGHGKHRRLRRAFAKHVVDYLDSLAE